MSKNLNQSAQETLVAISNEIETAIQTIETHDYSTTLAVSDMAERAASRTGLDKLMFQLVFSAVINSTAGESAYCTVQGRYGGVKPGVRKEPKAAKVSEKKQLQAKVAQLEAELAAKNAAATENQDSDPDTEFLDQLESVG